MSAATKAKAILGAVPTSVWLVGGGVLLAVIVGGKLAGKLGELVDGLTVGKVGEKAATAAGQTLVAAARAPAQALDSAISAATGREESLGTWLYSVFHDEAEEERQREEAYRLELARRQAGRTAAASQVGTVG